MVVVNRFRWFGWFVLCVGVILASYLTSSRVAAERKKLADVERAIAQTDRAIKALETEFDTRANLAQLERWNGETLKLSVPTAQQYLRSEGQLAQVDFNVPLGGDGGPKTQTAALVIPSAPGVPVTKAAPAEVDTVARVQAAKATTPVAAARTVKVALAAAVDAAPKSRPLLIKAASVAKPRTIAMIDRSKFLSDTTLDDLIAGARKERGTR
jgi:hypothetical protein